MTDRIFVQMHVRSADTKHIYQHFVLQSHKISTSSFCVSGNIVSFGCAGINRLGLFIKWKWWLNHKYIYITVNYNFYIHLQQVYTTNVYRSSAIYSKLCLKENVAKDESFKRLIYLLIQIVHVEHLIFVIGKYSIFDVIIKMRHTTLYIKFSRTRIYINYFWY